MRVLCLGLDGADDALVRDLVAQGKLPTLGRLIDEGAFGSLRSTIPAMTPTAWSSFLTGLNPGEHGILNWETNPNRAVHRVESAASRSGTPFWRLLGDAGIRSAFVMVPFTYPPAPIEGIVVTGYGGPPTPEIHPESARERIQAAYPGLVTAHHPMKERWWEDFDGFTTKLLTHVDEVAGVCKLALELEPDLQLLCVDFMSSDFAGHLAWHRLDPTHPAHDEPGDEIVRVYQAIDRACGELIETARTPLRRGADHARPLRPRDEADALGLPHEPLARGGRAAPLPAPVVPAAPPRPARRAREGRRAARPHPRPLRARCSTACRFLPAPAEDRAFADIDFGSTKAYCFATGGQIFLGEASGARDDPRVADEVAAALAAIPHPETGEPAFEVKRKDELFHGPPRRPRARARHPARATSASTSTRPAGRGRSRSSATITSTRSTSTATPATTACTGSSPPRAPGSARARCRPAPRSRRCRPRSAACSGSRSRASTARRSTRSSRTATAPRRSSRPRRRRAGSETSVYSDEEEAAMAERLRDLGYE